MQFSGITLPTAAENLAFDEALLETAELSMPMNSGDQADAGQKAEEPQLEMLRLWEPNSPMVVLGRSSPIQTEVNRDYCREHQIPVLRRCSGGATIVTAPGCLMYAVVLSYSHRPELRMLDRAHQYVMSQMQLAIRRLGIDVQIQGTSDLTLDDRKFSGNSLRCRRQWMLYHGTMICQDFDQTLVSQCLGTPKRQPNYRAGRDHQQFLTALPVATNQLASVIRSQWRAEDLLEAWPGELTHNLTANKYSNEAWNLGEGRGHLIPKSSICGR